MGKTWIDELPEPDRKALTELGIIKPKVKVHSHRCLECGKITKHVFCQDCYNKRRANQNNLPCPDCGKPMEIDNNSAECHDCEKLYPLSYFAREG